jgi:shikimate 5-dehydrogenase
MESRKRDDHQEDGGLGRGRVTVVNRHVESAEKLDRVLTEIGNPCTELVCMHAISNRSGKNDDENACII